MGSGYAFSFGAKSQDIKKKKINPKVNAGVLFSHYYVYEVISMIRLLTFGYI